MSRIKLERMPTENRLKELGVFDWPLWEKEEAEFFWFYSDAEMCYFLEGEVTVIPDNEQPVKFSKGDLVTFPKGMACTWKIHENVKKHYTYLE